MSLIEVTCVHFAIHMGQVATGDVAPQEVAQQPAQLPGGSIWEQVDSFSLEEIFSHRLAMLKTCPHFMRGRLRECFEIPVHGRHRAKMESDELREIRAWKLFGLVPITLIHRLRGTVAVGRSELAHRAEEFARGHWTALREEALRNTPAHSRGRPERSDAEESERPRKGLTSEGAERAGLPGATGTHRCCGCTQERSHIAGVARSETPGAVAADFPRKSWISCRQPKSV